MCKAGYYLNEDSKCLSCQQKYNTCSEYDPIFVSPYLCNVEAGFIFDAKYEDCTYSSSLKGLCTLMEDGMCQLCRPPLVQMLEEEDKVVCIDSRANCKVHLTSVGNLNLIAHCYVCNLGFYGAGEGATEDIMELAGGTNDTASPARKGARTAQISITALTAISRTPTTKMACANNAVASANLAMVLASSASSAKMAPGLSRENAVKREINSEKWPKSQKRLLPSGGSTIGSFILF